MRSDLPLELLKLPRSKWPPVEREGFALRVLTFDAKHHGGARPPQDIGWLASHGPLGVYDQDADRIWLNIELAAPEHEGELIVTLGHERWHQKQFRDGRLFTDGDAEYAGNRLLEKWRAFTAEYYAVMAESKQLAAAPIVRPIFPGSALEPTANPRADLALSGRGVRAEFRG